MDVLSLGPEDTFIICLDGNGFIVPPGLIKVVGKPFDHQVVVPGEFQGENIKSMVISLQVDQ